MSRDKHSAMHSRRGLLVLILLSVIKTVMSAVIDPDTRGTSHFEISARALEYSNLLTGRPLATNLEVTNLDLFSENRFGLFPSGDTRPEKTILLSHGDAEFTPTFTLVLRQGEELKSLLHTTNDSRIITSVSERKEKHRFRDAVSYNISLSHQFEGNVGVANYVLHVLTTRGATLRISGVYYVSGIVVEYSAGVVVSGIDSPGISFETAESLKGLSSNGNLPLKIKYQSVGPDVKKDTPSLQDIMSSATLSVKDFMGKTSALINFEDKCNPLPIMEAKVPKPVTFESDSCGIAFDKTSDKLILNLNPERYGSAVVNIRIHEIEVDGEAFETDIKVFVKKPPFPKPVVLIKDKMKLKLDHFGSETFLVEMENTVTPDQEMNATQYVVDLPGQRYAKIDFNSSTLAQPIQKIFFVTVPPGEEDKELLEKIRKALDALSTNAASSSGPVKTKPIGVDIRSARQGRSSMPKTSDEDDLRAWRPESSFIRNTLLTRHNNMSTEEFVIVGRQVQEDQYQSNVHVIIPPVPSLITAENPSKAPLLTSFAPSTTAVIHALKTKEESQNLLVTLTLKDYSIPTFSEHKSKQISASLSKQISKISKGNALPANLIKLKATGSDLEATYHLLVPMDRPDTVRDLMKKRAEVGKAIAADVLLHDDRVTVSNSMLVSISGGNGNFNGLESQATEKIGGLSGALIAAIVVLAVIVAIPLLVVLFGFIVERRHRERETSDMSPSDSAGAGDSTAAADGNSTNRDNLSDTLPAASPPVVRDNFGRVDDENYQSFKMQKEMFKEGYFTDNPSPDGGASSSKS